MAQFIGKSVRITLGDNSQVQGLVLSVENGQLQLNDVHYLNSGKRVGSAKFAGGQIKDLDILTSTAPSSHPPPPANGNPSPLVDPAVLSAGPAHQSTAADSSDESEVDENPYTAQEFINRGKNNNNNNKNKNGNTSSRPSTAPSTSASPGPKQQQRGQRRNKKNQNNNDSWDVREIKGSQEFDFQANLNLFDKQTVFDEIRQHDSTMPGARLVEHNRVPQQPHHQHTQPPQPPAQPQHQPPATNQQTKYGNREMILEPRSNQSMNNAGLPPQQNCLQFLNSGRVCPTASPMQLLELERLSNESFGMTGTMITENAGRGIAQLSLKALGGTSRFTTSNHNAHPLTVVLVGNNRSGCRALAAARHLANRHVRVLAVLAAERHELSPSIQAQLLAFESSKGKVLVKRVEALTTALQGYASPPELVLDGLQGYQQSAEDLWSEDVEAIAGLITWGNKQRCGVMSIDIPSGVDPESGQASPGKPFIHSKWVLSCGLPLSGVLNSQLNPQLSPATHYLLDAGYPQGALATGALKKFTQIWFGAEWILELTTK
jgi:enhancer of mRNA-decapping protein 3